MARQLGHIPIQGTIDNLTYLKTKDGFQVRKKGGVAPGRIKSDPRFKRTRENLLEFNEAAQSNKLIRNCFAPLCKNIADKRMMSRLTAALFPVIRTDAQNPRGYRKVEFGDLTLMKGFEFNAGNPFSKSFSEPVSATVNRTTGELNILLPDYNPGTTLKSPSEATHYRFVFSAATIDFEKEKFERDIVLGQKQVLDELPVAASSYVLQVPANSADPIFVLLGVEFFQENEDGLHSLLLNASYSSLQLILVDQQ